MKVAFVVEKFPNISETFILDEIVGAIQRGVEVDIFALRRGAPSDIHPAYLEYGLQARTRYSVPFVHGRIARLLAAVPATLRMLLRNPAALLACARTRKRGVQTRTFVSLARAFVNSAQRYDVIHAHFGPNGIRAQVLRQARVFNTPIITTCHGYDVTSFIADHGPSAYADLARHGECFIAVSQSIARAMQAIGIPENRTYVMPLGVDCSTPAPRAVRAPGDVVRVLSIGRFVEKKGFEFGIRAVVEARATGARLHYDVVGDGDLRAELEAIVARLGAADAVVFHGWKDRNAVATLLAAADIMLVPSVTAASGDQEGLPVVVKEAMACALPVVASRHAGIPEIVIDGQTGLLADERDHRALAAHLVRLAGDAEQRLRLGTAARALIETSYDNEQLVDALVALYRDVSSQAPV